MADKLISFCHGAPVQERERKLTIEAEVVETKVEGTREVTVADKKGNLSKKTVDNPVPTGEIVTEKHEAVETHATCGECGQPTNPFAGTRDTLAAFRRDNDLDVPWEEEADDEKPEEADGTDKEVADPRA